jgi:thiol-disulfide isomerase/thioredoxin
MRRAPCVRHRVDGVTGPFKAGNLLPFRVVSFYVEREQTQSADSLWGFVSGSFDDKPTRRTLSSTLGFGILHVGVNLTADGRSTTFEPPVDSYSELNLVLPVAKFILLFLIVAICALSVVSQSGRRVAGSKTVAPVQPPANPLPDIVLRPEVNLSGPLLFLPLSLREREIKALDTGSFRLDDFHGKVLVINVWASWCGPCRREVPEYERVRKSYAGQNVEFVGLTTENPRTDAARVDKFVRDAHFGFRLGWADPEMADMLMNGRNAIPQTLVINTDGRVLKHWTGYKRGQLKEAIDHALGQ